VTTEQQFEYARDDFNYPRFIQGLMEKILNVSIEKVKTGNIEAALLNQVRWASAGLAILTLLFGFYFWTAILVAVWLFLDQIHLHVFVDRSLPASRFRHFLEEAPLMLGLTLHFWFQGHVWTGFATLVGIMGIYLLTNLQMKYDLNAINLPRLYFLRWDRMGIIFLFTLLGAWPGERAYLFVVLLGWFLAALSFYDYIWILIQLAKKNK